MSERNVLSVNCSALITQPGVLSLAFEGYYPPGSDGNGVANEMVKHTLAEYKRLNPKAVLFDLEKLDYVWGDAICGIVVRLAVERREVPLSLPVCILACGRTHKALEPLFGNGRAYFGLAGARLFEDREQAMAYLVRGLNAKAFSKVTRPKRWWKFWR